MEKETEKLWVGQLPHSDSVHYVTGRAWEDVSRPLKSNEVRRDQKTEDEKEKKQEKDTK